MNAERIAAITKDNTKLFKRIAGVRASVDNTLLMQMQPSVSM